MATDMLRRSPANPLHGADRCALLFGLALIEQGFTPEQAAAQIDRTRQELERAPAAAGENKRADQDSGS